LGMKTACVEMNPTLGGTCLNVGCIPSKALLVSSEKYADAMHGLAAHGVRVGSVGFDLTTMMGHKEKVVKDNTAGIEYLFKKNKIDWLKGRGTIAGAGQVIVTGAAGAQNYITKNILIATGSESMPLPGITVDEKRIVTSTGALSLSAVPKTMLAHFSSVAGAGCNR